MSQTDFSQFKDLFINEVEDSLENLNNDLLKLEKDLENKDLLNDLMRYAHSVKGDAATMKFTKMAFLTHVMEDIFDYARNGVIKLTTNIIQKLFDAVDCLDKSLQQIRESDMEIDLSDQAEILKEASGVKTEGFGKSQRDDSGKPLTVPKAHDTEVANLPEVAEKADSAKNTNSEKKSEKSSEEENDSEVSIHKIEYINVPVKRLDVLMNLVEELLIIKMGFDELIKSNKESDEPGRKLVKHCVPLFKKFDRLSTDIQYHVMEARLVAISHVFSRFPRMVRDLAKTQKKTVDLNIEGGDIELDRSIIDNLSVPLTHLIRNAIDHGIVNEGKINLAAYRKQDYALITVEDNGTGIDVEKVVESALSKGVITRSEAENIYSTYSKGPGILPQSIVSLLLNPKVSTSEKVTEISGRGVGLNVVKNFIDDVGGRIFVENLEKGTRFSLQLPLTLAIIKVLLVRVGEEIFAIPASSIDRSIKIQDLEIKKTADQKSTVVDGQYVPLAHLSGLFGKNNGDQNDNGIESENGIVVLVKDSSDMIGFIVDELINEQEIIVKTLSRFLHNVKGFSGATILGDGKTALILDIPSVVENVRDLLNIN